MRSHNLFDFDSDNDEPFDFDSGGQRLEELAERSEEYLGDPDGERDLFEESSEDELQIISAEIRRKLELCGVEASKAASNEDLIRLWRNMDMSEDLIFDLTLWIYHDKQTKLRNSFARPRFNDVLQKSRVLEENPYEIRTKLIGISGANLVKLGYGRPEAYRLTSYSRGEVSKAFRFFGWLLEQGPMKEYPRMIDRERIETQKEVIPRDRLFALATDEIWRQKKIYQLGTYAARFDERVPYEWEAYKVRGEQLETLLAMCRSTFYGEK